MILQRESRIKFYDMQIEPIPALLTNLNSLALKKKKKKKVRIKSQLPKQDLP